MIIKNMGFEIVEYQINIMGKVLENIDLKQKMQVIMAPNGSGKTIMIMILASYLKQIGKKPMIYHNEEVDFYKYSHVGSKKRNNIEINQITVCNPRNIGNFVSEHFDVILTDSLNGVFDQSIDMSQPQKYLKDDFNESPRSFGEWGLIGLVGLHKLLQNENGKDTLIVSFERGKSAIDSGYTPIIATPYITCFDVNELGYKEKEAVVNEYLLAYDSLLKAKINSMVENKTTIFNYSRSTNKNFNADTLVLLERLDKLESSMKKDIGVVQKSIDHVADDVKDIKDTLSQINNIVSYGKDFMSMFYSVHEDSNDQEAERMISKYTEKLAYEILNKSDLLEKRNDFNRIRKTIILKLGEQCWNKMDSLSQRFLTTAKYTFYQQMDLEEIIDYSGVCVLASKAFEVELAKRFVNGYRSFVENDLKLKNDYSKWPGAILKKYYGKIQPKDASDFTLGDCIYIMGIKSDREVYKKLNNEIFLEYCQKKLLKINDINAIREKLKTYQDMIYNVKEKYRNPSSHKDAIDLATANGCLNYIAEMERVLGIMLDDFAF